MTSSQAENQNARAFDLDESQGSHGGIGSKNDDPDKVDKMSRGKTSH
jgi:hypothetical protein